MNCLKEVISCLSYYLEQEGLYEPAIDINEANDRLRKESKIWKQVQSNRNQLWNDFQARNAINGELYSLVEDAISEFKTYNVLNGVAVDLGCGINTTTFNLLEQGWRVYAVDSSDCVIQTLKEKVSLMGKTWIKDGQLILVNKKIENFEYPEKVNLIIATSSLPYCNPKKITQIFIIAKNALLSQGVLVCNLFPYDDNPLVDHVLRSMFGAWMTTKNVVDAVVRSVDFPEWIVKNGTSPGGIAQFHILARG